MGRLWSWTLWGSFSSCVLLTSTFGCSRSGLERGLGSEQTDEQERSEEPGIQSESVVVQDHTRKDQLEGMNEPKVVEKPDLSYGAGSARKLDVYIPAGANKAPVVFMVHGGAWRLGDKGAPAVVGNKMRHWTNRGYVFVSTNYRLSDVTPIEQAKDVAQALAFVQNNASLFDADPQRVVLIGHSSGAHLVSLLASDPSYSAEAGLRPWLGTIALDSAAFDVSAIMRRRHFPFYDRAFGSDERLWERASPLLTMRSAPAPFLAVCSTQRGDSCPQARAFVEKAKSLGGQATILQVAMSHRDINANLGRSGSLTSGVDAFLSHLGL